MKAAIYSRKSKFTGKGESVENQIQLCREYGMKYLDISGTDFTIYEDEGFSGGNTNRPQFQRMLKDAAKKKFDVLICYRLDRISRNVTDFSQLIKDLNGQGVNFVSVREQFDTSTPMGRAMMYIASVFSQLERETIAERIRDNMLQLAKTGRWLGGALPTGFRSETVISVDPGGKERKQFKLAPVLEEVNLVKLIYDKYIRVKSITQVEKYLVENNIRTKNGQDFRRYSIRFILRNPVYAIADRSLYDYLIEKGYDVYSGPDEFNGVNGLIGYNKTIQNKENFSERYRDSSEWIIAVGLHSGIIPGSEWIKAQELLDSSKSKAYRKVKNSKALLSGVLRCGKCGSFMRPKSVQRLNQDGEQVFYYMCELKEKSRKSRCSMANINGNELDKAVLNEMKRIIADTPHLFDELPGREKLIGAAEDALLTESEAVKVRIEKLEAEIQNMIAAIAKGQKDEVLSAILTGMEDMANERAALKVRLEQLNKQDEPGHSLELELEGTAQRLGDPVDGAWDMMNAFEKRNMIKSMVDAILWDGSKLEIEVFGSKTIERPEAEL